jgi:hypothetical protein
MVTQQDVEIYLDDDGFPFEKVDEGLWRVESPDNKVRINLMKTPQKNREAFYERLLRLNATEIPHGAFGIENDLVVLIDTLQIENLDRNELRASVDSLGFTAAQYYNELKSYLNA